MVAVTNHVGRLDAGMPYCLIDRADIIMLVAEKYREVAIFRWLARALDGVWVDRFNADLAADQMLTGSQISRFLLLHKELDADDGELTRTRKVKRGYIGERYQVLVDALYSGKKNQYIETPVKFEGGRSGVVAADLKIVDAKTYPMARRAA